MDTISHFLINLKLFGLRGSALPFSQPTSKGSWSGCPSSKSSSSEPSSTPYPLADLIRLRDLDTLRNRCRNSGESISESPSPLAELLGVFSGSISAMGPATKSQVN